MFWTSDTSILQDALACRCQGVIGESSDRCADAVGRKVVSAEWSRRLYILLNQRKLRLELTTGCVGCSHSPSSKEREKKKRGSHDAEV